MAIFQLILQCYQLVLQCHFRSYYPFRTMQIHSLFNGSIILECPSRTAVCKSGSVEGLSMKITAWSENCQILLVIFQWTFYWLLYAWSVCNIIAAPLAMQTLVCKWEVDENSTSLCVGNQVGQYYERVANFIYLTYQHLEEHCIF